MRAELTADGDLKVIAESGAEAYALKRWLEKRDEANPAQKPKAQCEAQLIICDHYNPRRP